MNVHDLTEVEDYLNTVRIPLRLACRTESGWPMVVSLWFLYHGKRLYCATQKTAQVVSFINNDPRCAFEIAADLPPYCGVRGQAVARIDEKIGVEILTALLKRYLGDTNNRLAENLLNKSEREVGIVLDPINLYTWDFTKRMQDVAPRMSDLGEKVCP